MAQPQKVVLAYSGGTMASAAYWVGCQAQAVYASQSSIVGSIGCYRVSYDDSNMFENAGVTATLIRSGKFKGGGAPGVPVDKAYIENAQRIVDGVGATFRAEVKMARKAVKPDCMEGQE
jgi:ClpP class serine protease